MQIVSWKSVPKRRNSVQQPRVGQSLNGESEDMGAEQREVAGLQW